MRNLKQRWLPNTIPLSLLFFGGLLILTIWASLMSEAYYLVGIPAVFLLAALTIVDYRKVFYLLLCCIPLSLELLLPNGFGTDLPTEPLIIGLMGVFIFQLAKSPQIVDTSFFRHPITYFIFLHLSWILLSTVTSENIFVSLKFLLAKIWYVVVFYFMAGTLLKGKKSLKITFWCVLLPLLVTMIIINIRHATYGFSFDSIFRVLNPFYRNHVSYACIMALMFPFVFFSIGYYKNHKVIRAFLFFVLLFFVISIYLSFTRAAYIAVLFSGVLYIIIRLRLVKYVFLLSIVFTILGLSYMMQQNNYLEYAPDYDKTVSHTEFDDLIEATYNLEDISLMERFHRWVGGFFMLKEKPLVGFGPGNFYNFYKPYTVNRFRTYVSDNPEKSGIHNYYLMTTVEQGLPGLFIFILLCFATLWKAEQSYHQCVHPLRKSWIMTTVMAFFVILVTLLINDLIETDKIGSFFFLTMAILVNFDLDKSKETIE